MTWSEGVLSDLAFFQRGFDITKNEQRPGCYPVVSSSGVKSHHAEFKVAGPGVVVGRKGTLGTVHYISSDFWPHDTSLWVKDFKGNLPRYVYYFLHTMDFGRFDVGGANPTLNRNHIHGIPIRIPPVEVQQRIIDVLSTYDDLIENNNRRMALLEEAIHLLYREWFVYLRFPGHVRVEVVDGVPEGWRRTPLSTVCHVNRESLGKRSAPAQIKYVDIASVTTGRVDAIQAMDFDGSPSRARRVVRHGDIIWATVRPGNRAYALILDPVEHLIASTGFAVLSPAGVPSSFLYCATTTDWFVAHMESIAGGAAYPAVRPPDFEAYELHVPTPHLLGEFDSVAMPSLRQMRILEQQNQRLREARDLLLPRLMNGNIAV